MFRYLFTSKIITIVALIIITIASIIIATLIIGSGENMSEIDKAANAQRTVFIFYILSLAITVFLSYIVWSTSNKYQDAVKADADARIKTAQASAETAKADIKKADVKIADLSLKSESLKTETEKAREGIAIANQKAAEANEKAESERLARLQLEARLADRVLTNEDQIRLTSLIVPFRGTEIDVFAFGGTFEVENICKILIKCLSKAGWKVHQMTMIQSTNILVQGIVIGIRPGVNETIVNGAQSLISGLQSMGITIAQGDFNQMKDPVGTFWASETNFNAPIRVFIGRKP